MRGQQVQLRSTCSNGHSLHADSVNRRSGEETNLDVSADNKLLGRWMKQQHRRPLQVVVVD
jgi:hypothetical protein